MKKYLKAKRFVEMNRKEMENVVRNCDEMFTFVVTIDENKYFVKQYTNNYYKNYKFDNKAHQIQEEIRQFVTEFDEFTVYFTKYHTSLTEDGEYCGRIETENWIQGSLYEE